MHNGHQKRQQKMEKTEIHSDLGNTHSGYSWVFLKLLLDFEIELKSGISLFSQD